MSETTTQPAVPTPAKPKRADALRNYQKLLTAAREAFTEDGAGASLEDIARRAGVGIGTLYRHFPTRQNLLEAVYFDEFEAIAKSATQLDDLEPWDALVKWLHDFVGYAVTKRAVAEELLTYVQRDAAVFNEVRTAITRVGDDLITRAQEAGVVRRDTSFSEVGPMVSGIATIRGQTPEAIHQILDVALDGLRYKPS
ncbi:MAG: TetR/AcrR family transcriptional regulator [Solirubrobacteraceae bacterium]|nr:TetR/AcrR family transcriptional regulator [Patulibacter sp.]